MVSFGTLYLTLWVRYMLHFCLISFKFQMQVVVDKSKNPIDFGSQGKRSRLTLALFVYNLSDTVQTAVLVQSMSKNKTNHPMSSNCLSYEPQFWTNIKQCTRQSFRKIIFHQMLIILKSKHYDFACKFTHIVFQRVLFLYDYIKACGCKRRIPIVLGSQSQRS